MRDDYVEARPGLDISDSSDRKAELASVEVGSSIVAPARLLVGGLGFRD